MSEKIKTALITGICGIIVGIIGTFGVEKVIDNQSFVTVNVNGETIETKSKDFQDHYEELQEEYKLLEEKYNQLSKENNNNNTKVKKNNNKDASKNLVSYLGIDIKSYQNNYYEASEVNDNKTISMGGIEYNNYFTLETGHNSAYALFNLQGKYQSIAGIIGHIDKASDYNSIIKIFGDDELIKTFELSPTNLPEEFLINVTGITQLKILDCSDDYYYSTYGFAQVVMK